VIEPVVEQHIPEPVRGAAESREIAFARLATPLARIASSAARAWRFGGDRDQQEEVYSMLQYAAEDTAGAVLSVIELGVSGDVSRLLVGDPETVEQLINKPARGHPVWHEQAELFHALKIWTTDLY
jgi:hypothetical protein